MKPITATAAACLGLLLAASAQARDVTIIHETIVCPEADDVYVALAPGPGTAFAAGLSEVGDDAISAYVREHGCALVGTGAHRPLIQRGALFSRIMVNSETMLVRSIDLQPPGSDGF